MMKLLWNRFCAIVLLLTLVIPAGFAQGLLLSPPPPARHLVSDEPALTGDVVVRFRDSVPRERRDLLITTLGCRVASVDPGSGYELVQVRGGRALDLSGILNGRAEVLHAEPSYRLHTLAVDSYFDPYEWYLFPRGMISARAPSKFGIQAQPAWELTRGKGVTIAVIDSGVAFEDYSDFYQAPGLAHTTFAPGYNFVNSDDHPNDDAGHGTLIAGVLAGMLIDGGGVIGVAPEATIMPVKVMRADGSGSDYNTARGIRWAVDHGAQVINLSVGGQRAGDVLAQAVQYAAAKDCVVVAAAGNDNAPEVEYPAYYSDCIAVGATDFAGIRAPYSNRGRKLELMAPGGNLRQDLNGDGRPDGIVAQTFDPRKGYNSFDYVFEQGTSFSSPQVAGVAALVRAANPDLPALEVRLALRDTALPLGGTTGRNNNYGYGLVDALAAVKAALAQK